MALARKRAAATSARAELEKPEKANDNALLVPNCSVPSGTSSAAPISFAGTGESPSKMISKTTITASETGYLRASVTHMITSNARTYSALSPTTPSASGAGKKLIITKTKQATIIQTGL